MPPPVQNHEVAQRPARAKTARVLSGTVRRGQGGSRSAWDEKAVYGTELQRVRARSHNDLLADFRST